MNGKKKNCSRRDFLKSAGLAGAGSIFAAMAPLSDASGKSRSENTGYATMPTRPFGKTGVNVPILSLGGIVDFTSNQILLNQALRMGVSYWDTASGYEGGKSEEGIGKYFVRFPEDRKKVFLVTKSKSHDPDGMTKELNRSLKRMNTSYVDLFFMHSVKSPKSLTPHSEMSAWVEQAKKTGKIRLFGLSTHSNMEDVMMGAAKLTWIDGIMMTYNFRIMHTDRMKKAVDTCIKAGIGLTAMKTQGGWSARLFDTESEISKTVVEKFLKRGFTPEQTKLKAVWENPHIASICSHMPNLTVLKANVAAALDMTKLSSSEVRLLNEYSAETASTYCAGCANLCERATNWEIPVNDIMRYLMYCRSYGNRDLAKSLFSELPPKIREKLAIVDYSGAEKICPQGMAIGKLVTEAIEELA
jgi:predicted aldo/keto reductase-like oxidoreductase